MGVCYTPSMFAWYIYNYAHLQGFLGRDSSVNKWYVFGYRIHLASVNGLLSAIVCVSFFRILPLTSINKCLFEKKLCLPVMILVGQLSSIILSLTLSTAFDALYFQTSTKISKASKCFITYVYTSWTLIFCKKIF